MAAEVLSALLDRQAAFHGADPYAVLGAEYDATDEALRKLFRQLSRP